MSAARSSSSRESFTRAATSRVVTDNPAPKKARARRSDPVRVTIDLTPEDHRALTQVTGDLAEALDVPKVHQAKVWRALLAELSENPRLLSAVRARIADDLG